MGEIYGRWQTAVDANLNALPGAKLSTYDAIATTTPKTTYQDAELTTPHSNPIIANASGQFPQVFADTTEAFYLVLKTSADVLVEDYENVEALGGSGSGAFARDFGTGGRWQVNAPTLGPPNVEFGDPIGDDVGGSGRIGGWNGTRGDDLEIDFDDVVFNGSLTVNGQFTVDAVSALFPTLSGNGSELLVTAFDIVLDPAYEAWEIQLRNLMWSTNGAQLTAQVSYDGTTFKSGASDYVWQTAVAQASATTYAASAFADTSMRLNGPLTGSTAMGGMVHIDVNSKSGAFARFMSRFSHVSQTATAYIGSAAAGVTNSTYGKAQTIRFTVSAGTVSFDYAIMGLPK